jgi:hypothetical protein
MASFNIPLYVIILILIILSMFLVVRENFIGFDEQGVPRESRYPLIICNPFTAGCL